MAGGSLPVSMSSSKPVDQTGTKYLAPLAVLTTLFFMWGFITSLNDILSPHLQSVFELNYFESGLIQTAFFAAYFVVSIPSSLVVKRMGYKPGIIVGLLIAAAGCALFYPAANVRSFGLFLAALFVLAAGITLLQVAANPFVAVLGRPETSSSRLTLTQAFNSLGTTLGPKFGNLVILSGAVLGAAEIAKMSPDAQVAYKATEAQLVQTPYVGLAIALVVLAAAMAAFKLPKIDDSDVAAATTDGDDGRKSAWAYPHLVFGAVAIFVYVGAEVAIGNYLVAYFKEPIMGGLTASQAGDLVPYYWGGAMIGRFIGSSTTLRRYRPGKVLAFHAVGAIALIVISMFTTDFVGRWSLIAVGLFNSIMFPTIFTIAIDGLGKHTSQGSGILCMAIVGGAIIPPITGALADRIGLHHCFFLAALCYMYIVWYGFKGHPPLARKAA